MVFVKQKFVLLTAIIFLLFVSLVAYAEKGFLFDDMAGNTHRLSQYKGKWVVVNYWATWCPPCLEEIPDLVAIYDNRKDKDVMMIGVVFDYETTKEVTDYVDDMLISYPIVLGNANIESQLGVAEVLPTTYIFNPVGQLVKIKRGVVSRQYLETIMQ